MNQQNSMFTEKSRIDDHLQEMESDMNLCSYLNNDSNGFQSESNPNFHHSNQYSEKLKSEIVLTEIESINSELMQFTQDRVGNLTVGDGEKSQSEWHEIQKTIQLVRNLLCLKYKDEEQKTELRLKCRKYEFELTQSQTQIEKQAKEKRALDGEKDALDALMKKKDRDYKDKLEKIEKEKEEIQKSFKAIQARENQYKAQFRKHQDKIEGLNQKVKNKNADKNQLKNKFEVVQEIHNNGPNLILTNADSEFNQFHNENFEEIYSSISNQNQYLKDCLVNIYRQLNNLLEVKRQTIRKRGGFQSALESEAFELQELRAESLRLPQSYSKEAICSLTHNLNKFKEAMKIGGIVNGKVQDNQIKCMNNIKELMQGYKSVIEDKDKIINRVVLKSKEFKSNEMANIEGKFGAGKSSLEDEELEQSKRFLEEQRQLLISRNKDLERARKAMVGTVKKAEQQRQIFARKREDTSEQMGVLKKNIQSIPKMVEEELKKVV